MDQSKLSSAQPSLPRSRSPLSTNLKSTLFDRAGVKIPTESRDQSFWPKISNIHDLTEIYLHVVEDAISELVGKKSSSTWNVEGYYFAENGRHYWQEVAKWIAEEATKQGFIKDGGGSLSSMMLTRRNYSKLERRCGVW